MSKKKIPQIVTKIRNYKPERIDYKLVKSFSYSQISTFHTCELKWKLGTIDKISPYNPSIHTVFGTTIHESIQKFLTIYYESTIKEASEYPLEKYFYNKLRINYQKEVTKNNNIHFTNPDELQEFYEDGIEIIKYLKSKVKKYFSKKDYYLIGCEIPLQFKPENYPKSVFTGYIDLVIYHEPSNTITLYDLKTSTSGWKDNKKKDILTTSQLLIYKEKFSELFDFPIENINVEYFILKRKLPEDSDFVIKRFQQFIPTQGKIKVKQAVDLMNTFLEKAHTKEGHNIEGTFKQIINSKTCKFCQYNNTKYCQI